MASDKEVEALLVIARVKNADQSVMLETAWAVLTDVEIAYAIVLLQKLLQDRMGVNVPIKH